MSITLRARIKDGVIYPKEDLHLKEGDVTITINESDRKEFLNRVEAGKLKGYTSVVVLDEVFHRLMLAELYIRFSILPYCNA